MERAKGNVTGTPVLECRNVGRTFEGRGGSGKNEVLRGVNFEVHENEFLVLFGAGQCGKTTLLNILAGLDMPTEGEVYTRGQKVTGPAPERGVVYQKTSLFPWMTVQKNVEYGLKQQKMEKSARAETARKYLNVVGLDGFADAYPKELSGGMKQRVAIARALAANPESLLLDEPFGALDTQTRSHMQELTLDVWRQYPKTIVMVTHDIEEAIFMADRIVVMRARPGSVKEIIDVNLPRDRDFYIKSDPAFLDYKRHINELIYEESLKLEQEALGA